MKILNLYAGIGGNRKLWGDEHEITAVEHNEKIASIYQEENPDDIVIISCAHEYLLKHFKEFNFIWSSPPCPTHSKMAKFTKHDLIRYPDMKLYQEIILLQNYFKGKWCVENVDPYYIPLIPSIKKVGRHLFWSNFPISHLEVKNAKNFINMGTAADSEQLKNHLDIHYKGNIYVDGNHDPCQVLRNCVNPNLGKHILNCGMNIIAKENINQGDLFE